MKTIAQQWGITKFPFVLYDADGNKIYYENSEHAWCRKEYDDNGNQTYSESSNGKWWRVEYDAKGNETYFEGSDGITKGTPSRVEFTMEELSKKLGVPLAQLKIKGSND